MKMAQKKCFTVTVLIISLIFLYADHNLLSPNLTQISDEFKMTPEERDLRLGGQISLGFYLVGIPSSMIFGWLSDTIDFRSKLFAVAIMISEVACFSTYFVQSFEMLLLMRTLTGIGIGASLPVIYSILSDFFEAQGRNISSAIVSSATGIGLGIGQGLSGFLGPTYGWRFPFLIVSLPAFSTALLCLLYFEDPDRAAKESAMINAAHWNVDNEIDLVGQMSKEDSTVNNFQHQVNKESKAQTMVPNNKSLLYAEDSMENIVDTIEIATQEQFASSPQEESKLMVKGNLSSISPIVMGSHLLLNDCQHNFVANETKEDDDKVTRRNIQYPAEKPSIRSTLKLVQTPTLALILIQGIPSVIPLGMISTFLNDYLSQEKGLSIEAATATLLTFGVGNMIGVLIGGYFGHLLYKKDKRYPSFIMGISTVLTAVPMWSIINMKYEDDAQVVKASIVMIISGILSVFPLPIERAILNNVSLPESRGRANSFLSVIDNLGKAAGPYLLSLMTSRLGRQKAFSYSLLGWIVGGSICLVIFFTVEKDEKATQEAIAQKLRTNMLVNEP